MNLTKKKKIKIITEYKKEMLEKRKWFTTHNKVFLENFITLVPDEANPKKTKKLEFPKDFYYTTLFKYRSIPFNKKNKIKSFLKINNEVNFLKEVSHLQRIFERDNKLNYPNHIYSFYYFKKYGTFPKYSVVNYGLRLEKIIKLLIYSIQSTKVFNFSKRESNKAIKNFIFFLKIQKKDPFVYLNRIIQSLFPSIVKKTTKYDKSGYIMRFSTSLFIKILKDIVHMALLQFLKDQKKNNFIFCLFLEFEKIKNGTNKIFSKQYSSKKTNFLILNKHYIDFFKKNLAIRPKPNTHIKKEEREKDIKVEKFKVKKKVKKHLLFKNKRFRKTSYFKSYRKIKNKLKEKSRRRRLNRTS